MRGYSRPSPDPCPKCRQSRRLPRRFGSCASTSIRRTDRPRKLASAGGPPPFEYEGAQYQPCSQTCVPSLYVPSCARWQEPETTIPRPGRKSNESFACGPRAQPIRAGIGTEDLSHKRNAYGTRCGTLTAGVLLHLQVRQNALRIDPFRATTPVSGTVGTDLRAFTRSSDMSGCSDALSCRRGRHLQLSGSGHDLRDVGAGTPVARSISGRCSRLGPSFAAGPNPELLGQAPVVKLQVFVTSGWF